MDVLPARRRALGGAREAVAIGVAVSWVLADLRGIFACYLVERWRVRLNLPSLVKGFRIAANKGALQNGGAGVRLTGYFNVLII